MMSDVMIGLIVAFVLQLAGVVYSYGKLSQKVNDLEKKVDQAAVNFPVEIAKFSLACTTMTIDFRLLGERIARIEGILSAKYAKEDK